MKTIILSFFSLVLSVCALALGWMNFHKQAQTNSEIEKALLAVSHLRRQTESDISSLQADLKMLPSHAMAIQPNPAVSTATPAPQSSAPPLTPSPVMQTPMPIPAPIPSSTLTNDWTSVEIGCLIRLAIERLYTVEDVKTAIRLLETAQHKIKTSENIRYIHLRASLEKDLITLKNITLPDKEGLWVKISAWLADVPQYPLRRSLPTTVADPHFSSADASAVIGKQNESAWQKNLVKTGETLKNLVKIQKHSAPIEPLLSESEQRLVKAHLALILEALRLSVLQRDIVAYSTLIKESKQCITQFFDLENARVNALQAELMTLEKINLKPDLPNLAETLQQLSLIDTSSKDIR